ncbi:STAS/SEC14 domain-containing protein [Ideonella sp.]|uniref:STAS/SEC14 domain-containing protein n=1 Tax=Ideonella sp. TaxID=1929293 RepID=UPI003BB5DF4F
MPVSVVFESKQLVRVHATGVLTRAEVDDTKRLMFAHMMEHGVQHLLFFIEPDFGQLQAFANWDDIPEDRFIQQHVVRLALVGDMRWRDQALLFFLSGLVPFQIEYFNADQEEFARAWLLG